VKWEGVGVLRKNGSGDILLESAHAPIFSQQAIPAIRVNRQDAQHTLLVGDRERTSGEMTEWRREEGSRRTKFPWWIIAVILAAIGLVFLGWYFYTHGFSTANQTKL
jgi:hypothetical protein